MISVIVCEKEILLLISITHIITCSIFTVQNGIHKLKLYFCLQFYLKDIVISYLFKSVSWTFMVVLLLYWVIENSNAALLAYQLK